MSSVYLFSEMLLRNCQTYFQTVLGISILMISLQAP